MKKIFFTFIALVPLLSAFGQGIIAPERIHIGDTSSFPVYSDGPVKIFSANNLSYGLLLLKNPISNLCTAADFYNDKNLRLTIGIAGSENSNFYRNCGYIFMSDQNSDNPAEGLVIGHRYASAPIIFAQNNKEVLRISAEGNVGIGTSTPEVPLRIEAEVPDGNGRALIRLRNTSYAPTASVSYGLESNDGITGSTFTHTSSSFTAIPDFDNFSVIASNGKGFAVYTTKPYSSIRFYTNIDDNGIIERMRITGNGNVGIGTKEPKAKVEIADGDIFISDINKGIIMKSSDGQCWKGTLDNSGTLSFMAVNCEDLLVYSTDNKSADRLDLSIFPNPVQNTVTIASQQHGLKNVTALLYTIDGKIVKKERLFSDYSILKLNDIPAGTYVIKVVNKKDKEIGSEKIVKNQ
jgi:hypothetical protein